MDVCRRREDCRLCGSFSIILVCSLEPTPPANEFLSSEHADAPQKAFPLELYLCEDCGHLQLGHVIDPELLFRNYLYVSGTSPAFVSHFRNFAKTSWDISDAILGDLVIDIGSNDGTLLKAFKELGASVLGVDPARKIAEEACAFGIPTIIGFFNSKIVNQIIKERGKAKIITGNNVFAHIDDLGSAISNIRDLLQPDGIFVFEVSYRLDVIEKTLFDTIYHEHLDYHSVKSLREFLKSRGFKLFHVERVASHGGSIRVFSGLQNNRRIVTPNVKKLIQIEIDAGIYKRQKYSKFSQNIAKSGHQLTAEIVAARQAGRKIAGYGAPAKATTLLHQFGISAEDLLYIVDDSPWKQGLVTPGLKIPIVPASYLEYEPVDDLVLLAWNFAKPIIDKNKSFLTGNRRFIVPMPQLRMVTVDAFK